jgi:hypothetical protein
MSQATMEPAVADAAIGNSADEMGAASADDQLSKLAGNEIDRLLADSESGREITPPPARSFESSTELDGDKDRVDLALEIDDLVEGLNQPGEAKDPAAAPTETAAASAAAAEESRLKVLASELEVDKPIVAEKPIAAAPIAPVAAVEHEPSRSPIVRLLIMINAPLAGCSDTVRSLMGKAAILTFLNAAAMLVYVVVFRKTH